MNWMIPLGVVLGLWLVAGRQGRKPCPTGVPYNLDTATRISRSDLHRLISQYSWPPGITPILLDVLAFGESRRDPRRKTGSHRGIWQLSERFFDPDVDLHSTDLRPVVKHFTTLAKSYQLAGITPDHPHWAELVFAGHNAGFSRASGVAYVAEQHVKHGGRIEDVSAATLPTLARKYGATQHLRLADTVRPGRGISKQQYWMNLSATHAQEATQEATK